MSNSVFSNLPSWSLPANKTRPGIPQPWSLPANKVRPGIPQPRRHSGQTKCDPESLSHGHSGQTKCDPESIVFFGSRRRLSLQYLLLSLLLLIPAIAQAETAAQPLPSLQSFTGIWDMPTARVLSDWNMRIKYGNAEPYRYYGVALGVFDRLEFHGQFTEVSSVASFSSARLMDITRIVMRVPGWC